MQKLRVLFVSHNVINNYAGAGKVHYELKQEYEKAGFEVEKVDLKDLFPNGQNSFQKIFGTSYTTKLLKYLIKNAYKYDVIDANFTNIIYPKEAFNFKGLLFVRSQGIMPLYNKSYGIESFANASAEIEKNKTFKNHIGSFLRSLYKDFSMNDFNKSVENADIIHCLNQSEYNYFIETGIEKDKLVLLPNGLSKEYLKKLREININRKSNFKVVAFVGAWHLVKGIKDWREISNSLSKIENFRNIKILGAVMPKEYVKQDFDTELFSLLTIVPKYKPGELPELLKDVKVGVSTSYMEGLPYAVLEQLSSGIPVVGYNVPGVSDFLLQIDSSLLIEPGNIQELVDKVKSLLEMKADDYELLSKKCIEISKKYVLEDIAPLFIDAYSKGINKLNHIQNLN